MALKALEGFAPRWFTPSSQRELEEYDQTQFQIKPLNSQQLDLALQGRVSNGKNVEFSAEGVEYALRFGLVGWRNFQDSKGDVKFSINKFQLIPWAERGEIARDIIEISFLQEDEEKNS